MTEPMATAGPPVAMELRVHGVHGTSPATMLGVDRGGVRQVAGDGLTGFYRIADEADPPLRRLPDAMALEAYSWGTLTSGVQGLLGWVKRVLWLLLLPFALANLAYWARLQVGENSGRARWGARAVRLSAVLLTVFAVLTPCVVAVDMVAWQCFRGNSTGCTALPGVLDFMAALTASQRLAVGSLAPLSAVLVLFVLSRQTIGRYEAVAQAPRSVWDSDAEVDPPGPSADAVHAVGPLNHPKMWAGARRTRRLQRLHLTVALATVVAFTGVHVLRPGLGVIGDRSPAEVWAESPAAVLTTAAAALLAAVATVLVGVVHPDDMEFFAEPRSGGRARTRPGALRQVPAPAPGWLAVAMLGVTLLHLLVLWTGDFPHLSEQPDFYGHNVWFVAVFVTLTVVHLVVFTGGRMSGRGTAAVAAGVLALGVLGIWLYEARPFGRFDLAAGAGGVALLLAAVTTWHYRSAKPPGDETRALPVTETAWRGAAASVLLAGGAWVALLFTTAVVTGSAEYLNGPDHTVVDLVTRSPDQAASSVLLKDQLAGAYVTLDGEPLEVTGPVRIHDALVLVDPRTLAATVRSGTIAVGSLGRPQSDLGASEQLRSTRFSSARLSLDDDEVVLRDSCVRSADTSRRGCSGESADFRAGATLTVADSLLVLDAGSSSVLVEVADPPQLPLVVPQVLVWAPVLQLIWLLLVMIALGWCALRFSRRVRPSIRAYLRPGPGQPRDVLPVPARDVNPAIRARVRAALAHRAERLLDVVGFITSPVALTIIVMSFTGQAPWEVWEWTRLVAALSLYVALGMSLVLVLVASQVRRSESARRGLGVLWDLTTFWPRAAHPLAPPCYAERVVPELCTRAQWALDRPESRAADATVILSGHSQGSLIVTAVACRLRGLARVRLVTYGSQVRALYGRVFPSVVGSRQLGYVPTDGAATLSDAWPDAPTPGSRPQPGPPGGDHLRSRLGDQTHWRNLFRRTDPLGYRVYSDLDGVLDVPTCEVPVVEAGDAGPQVMTHSGYQHTIEYRRVLAAWTGEPVLTEPPGTTGVPPLPL